MTCTTCNKDLTITETFYLGETCNSCEMASFNHFMVEQQRENEAEFRPPRSDSLTTPLGCCSFLQIPPPLRVAS